LDLIVDDGSTAAIREVLDPKLSIDSPGAAPRTQSGFVLNWNKDVNSYYA
jgi:hypothetical protein